MLVRSDDQSVISDRWQAAPIKAEIPESMRGDYFVPRGPTSTPDQRTNQRGFHRFHLRGIAVLTRGNESFGAYTKDISRQGIGFLSPVQLFPLERAVLELPNGTEYKLEVARCRRVGERCYECGARFAL